MTTPFDPDAAAAPGSGPFGLDHAAEDALIHVLPVPFDATTSYRDGTAAGPEAILAATHQVELADLAFGKPYLAGLHWLEVDPRIAEWNKEAREYAEPIIARGGAIETVSHLWIPMLLLEIPLIWFAGAGLRRMGARGLIAAGIALDGARWLATALAPGLTWIFGIQLLHGAVVVGLIIGMQLYVEGEVPERLRVTGQTLLGTMMSLGAVLSHLWAGLALERLGADAPYLIAGPVALVLGIAAWFFLGPGTDGSRQP